MTLESFLKRALLLMNLQYCKGVVSRCTKVSHQNYLIQIYSGHVHIVKCWELHAVNVWDGKLEVE